MKIWHRLGQHGLLRLIVKEQQLRVFISQKFIQMQHAMVMPWNLLTRLRKRWEKR